MKRLLAGSCVSQMIQSTITAVQGMGHPEDDMDVFTLEYMPYQHLKSSTSH